jgi:NAD(P)-dependent dehydrogenase (short-subunit alcohol dehydrogenase family)
MALSQSALSEPLEVFRAGEGVDLIREAVRVALQDLIELEAEQVIGAGRYERSESRTTERNGSRPRTLTTKAGDVRLAIPKLRKGSFFPEILAPRRRIDQALHAVVMEAYVHGVSTRSVDDLVAALGVHFNPSAFRQVDALHLTTCQLFQDLAVGVASLLPAVQAAKRFMPAGARVLVTGSQAADTPWHEAPSLGMQKAAVRNLVTSLDETLATDGIRTVAVQVNGVLATEGPFSPPQVAEALYAATVRPDDDWTPQVPYGG